MNQKIIKQIVRGKLKAWINSIKDEKVKNLVEKNVILTGGSIASLLLNETPKDYDVYFKNKETVKAVANYYVNIFNEKFPETGAIVIDGAENLSDSFNPAGFAGGANLTPDRIKIGIKSQGVAAENPQVLQNSFEDAVEAISILDSSKEENLDLKPSEEKFRPIFLSSNAITLSDQIQIVVRFYGEATEIHKNYDFVHCTNWYDYDTKELVLQKEALIAIMAKELRYQGSRYPLCSVIRTRKFLKRGWHINAGQYLKMMFQISNLDLTDINVLEDQLVGVDSAYFNILITALKEKEEADATFKVDESYLTTIIDKLF